MVFWLIDADALNRFPLRFYYFQPDHPQKVRLSLNVLANKGFAYLLTKPVLTCLSVMMSFADGLDPLR